jgi:peptide/nickel transport system substrate-binding protein
LSIVLVAGLILAACGPTPEPQVVEKVVTEVVEKVVTQEVEVQVTPTPEPEMEPQYGGGLKVVAGSGFRTLNPLKTSSITHNSGFALFYEPLVKPKEILGASSEFAPLLAESWEVADDGLSITFNLQEGVAFHDGTPFNAEAVKFNFEYRMNPDNAAVTVADFALVESIEVVDDLTVKVNFSAVDPTFLGKIGYPNNAMISPKALEELGEDLGVNPVGTGPFVLGEFTPGECVVGLRNDDYWNPKYPYLDQIQFCGVPESSARTLALESGEADVVFVVLWSDADFLREKGIELVASPPGLSTSLIQNNNKPPTDELAVRKAIAHAVDFDAILKAAFNGQGLVNRTGLLPHSWGYCQEAEDMAPKYDPELAAQILEEAGWVDTDGDAVRDRDGEPLTIYFIVPPWDADPLIGEIVIGQLARVGIHTTTETVEAQTLFAKLLEGDYGMSHWGLMPRTLDPHEIYHFFHSEDTGNRFQYANPEVDALIEEAVQTADQNVRAELYCEIQKKLIEDMATVWAFHEAYYVFGYDPDVVHDLKQAYYRVIEPLTVWVSR